ncbi:MAG: alpha/beta hydrolase [Parvularculaceae bacterium]
MADFIRIPTNQVPPGGEVFDFKGADGGRLRAAVFQAQNARGGVVLMAGRSEFIEKYFEVANDLLARGLSVATMDWRGQGLSERLLPVSVKGHITDFGAYRADLRLFTEEIAKKRFSGPLVLLTHSMGGLPALQLLADGYDAFSAAVLSAPMTNLFSDPLKRLAAGAMAQAACAIGASRQSILGVKEYSLKFEGNVLTSDRARHARFKELQAAAPNAILREPTYGWLKAAADAIDDIHKPNRFAKLKTPVLIVSAENDHLVDSNDHKTLAARSPLIDRVTIPGSLHEILMESDPYRNAFWQAFDAFVEPRITARA